MIFKFHHIGLVVDNISSYEKEMFFEEKINEVLDPIQKAKLALYRNFNNSFIELIEPLNETSPSYNSLNKYGNHYNHLCYIVYNFNDLVNFAEDKNWLQVFGPVPAILFENKEVIFFYTPNKQILEFIIEETL